MDQGWSSQSSATALDFKVEFIVDKLPDLPRADLVLDGLWWEAAVTLNGRRLPPISAAVSPARVDVRGLLKAGKNTIRIQVRAPSEGLPALISGGRTDGVRLLPPALEGAPRIELRPAAWVRATHVLDGGEGFAVSAVVESAPEGSTVAFKAVLDGRLIQDLGVAEVHSGRATIETLRWNGPLWGPHASDDGLFLLVSELVGPDGTVLDVASQRTGVRRDPVSVHRRPGPILGVRVKSGSEPASIGRAVLTAGFTAAEIHGRAPTSAWMGVMDELGLPVVMLTHCIGRVSNSGEEGASLGDDSPKTMMMLSSQVTGIFENLGPHPSLQAWAVEGGPTPARVLGELYDRDPRQRLVLGWNTPGVNVGSFDPAPERTWEPNAWLIEVMRNDGRDPHNSAAEVASWNSRAFASLVTVGQGVGGAFWQLDEVPPETELRALSASFGTAAREVGANVVEPGPRRGSSLVEVAGAQPGQVVWLRAPWHSALGAVADAAGTAHLSAWHEGTAEVDAGGVEARAKLVATSWVDYVRQGAPTRVSVAAGARGGSGS